MTEQVNSNTIGLQAVSQETLEKKYCRFKEKVVADVQARVAKALAESPKQAKQFREAQAKGMIMGGRINSAAGTDLKATLINCFVQPVGDATRGEMVESYYVEGKLKPSIYDALSQAGETMRRGGGVGYNFSELRPRGSLVKSLGSLSSGPLSYMDIFDRACATVASAGMRRGAQMGILSVSHPDVEEFITAKQERGRLTQFNVSVAVTDDFMEAVENNEDFELVHVAEPGPDLIEQGAYRRDDGMWVYKTVNARELWDKIMEQTYDHAEPGVYYIDRVNQENNLHYCEVIECSNPCAEQPLPDYGCCCLGSINLTKFVRNPFTDEAEFDFEGFKKVAATGARMLDRVLDVTYWPLDEQKQEAHNKRRVGLGFLGVGSAFAMLGVKYGSDEAQKLVGKIAEAMMLGAYWESVEMAKEKGAFPLFDADKYLQSGFAKRLPKDLRAAIKKHGIRNSHLLSIAPTGTIALTFADNASNGIEPAFSWYYPRKITQDDGTRKTVLVEDHAFRMYRISQGVGEDQESVDAFIKTLPEHWITALELTVDQHIGMMAAVQPFIDTSISKTINVPADYPFEDFKEVYQKAYRMGIKCVATFRPNYVTGSILGEDPAEQKASTEDLPKVELPQVEQSALAQLRWPSRPSTPGGAEAWTYQLETSQGNFAVSVSHVENGRKHPFEVWVMGDQAPRGASVLGKLLSMDLRSNDRAWVKSKLESLTRTKGDPVQAQLPPTGEMQTMSSLVSAIASVVRFRLEQLGYFNGVEDVDSPMAAITAFRSEPKVGPKGASAWFTDVSNAVTGDDFVVMIKEADVGEGKRMPYSIWLTGAYPRDWDGITKLLSKDMQVMDLAWIAKKLSKMRNVIEAEGGFMAKDPATDKVRHFGSSLAYVATLVTARYQELGLLDSEGLPVETLDYFSAPAEQEEPTLRSVGAAQVQGMAGKACPECGAHTYIKKDGCDFCTTCGHIGSCG